MVQKYLGRLGRDSVYRQIRAAACTLDLPQEVMQDAIDTAMMEFGEERLGACRPLAAGAHPD